MVHDSGVSREKRSDNGHGNEDVGGCERMSGAFCESASAVWGGICDGGRRRFGCVMLCRFVRLEEAASKSIANWWRWSGVVLEVES